MEKEGMISWLKVKTSHPLLFENVVPFLLGFHSTWLIGMQIEKIGDLLLKLNQGLEQPIDKLIDKHQKQCNHLSGFIFSTTFKKMYFLQYRVSICDYVGHKFVDTKNGPQGRKD